MGRRRYRHRKRWSPIISLFLLGIFTAIGLSPSSVIFDTAVMMLTPYIQYAALIAALIVLFFIWDSIISPILSLFKAFKSGGIIGIFAACLAYLGGIFFLVNSRGILFTIASIVVWKIALIIARY
jgi:hypothetical protein